MNKFLTIVGGIVLLCLVPVAIFALTYGGQEFERFFKPRDQAIERQVFEQTPSFVHGKTQHIGRLRLKYETAETEAARKSFRSIILSEAAVVDWNLLPPSTRSFLQSL